MKNIYLVLFICLSLFFVSCHKDKSAIDKATDKINEKIDDASDAAKDGVKKAGGALEDVSKAIENIDTVT